MIEADFKARWAGVEDSSKVATIVLLAVAFLAFFFPFTRQIGENVSGDSFVAGMPVGFRANGLSTLASIFILVSLVMCFFRSRLTTAMTFLMGLLAIVSLLFYALATRSSEAFGLSAQILLPAWFVAILLTAIATLIVILEPQLRTKEGRKSLNDVFFYTLIAIIFIYLMFPFYWALISSLKVESELIRTPASFLPQQISFQNFSAVLSNERFLRGLLNSLIVASSATIISLLIGSFAGFALGKMRFRGRSPALYGILAMTMFPQVAVLAGIYAVIRLLSLPTTVSLILSYLVFTLPFTVWVLTAFFKGLPVSLLQAAQVDGATMMQTFWQILLPLTAPALVTTGLLAFINAWNEYLFSLTLTSTNPNAQTVPVAIANLSGRVARQEPTGEIMAGALIVTVPLVILVLVFQKRIVDGLTAGAVKG
ncbi:MAG: ABC transporter permease subunit [Deinococcota bacterium]